MSSFLAWAFAAALAVVVVLFHVRVLLFAERVSAARETSAGSVSAQFLLLLAAHAVEILFFAVGLRTAGAWGLGRLDGEGFRGAFEDYVYFSAVSYSTLGYGDVRPLGDLRFVASVEGVVGLLMIAFSAAFSFRLVRRNYHVLEEER